MQAVKNYSCTDKFVPHTIKGTQNRYFNSTNNKNTLSEMYRKKIPLDINCGVKIAMEVIGGKWKTYILYELDRGARRPSQLHRLFGDASPRVINMQLKELETHGMIKKTVYPGLPPHVEYYHHGRREKPYADNPHAGTVGKRIQTQDDTYLGESRIQQIRKQPVPTFTAKGHLSACKRWHITKQYMAFHTAKGDLLQSFLYIGISTDIRQRRLRQTWKRAESRRTQHLSLRSLSTVDLPNNITVPACCQSRAHR